MKLSVGAAVLIGILAPGVSWPVEGSSPTTSDLARKVMAKGPFVGLVDSGTDTQFALSDDGNLYHLYPEVAILVLELKDSSFVDLAANNSGTQLAALTSAGSIHRIGFFGKDRVPMSAREEIQPTSPNEQFVSICYRPDSDKLDAMSRDGLLYEIAEHRSTLRMLIGYLPALKDLLGTEVDVTGAVQNELKPSPAE